MNIDETFFTGDCFIPNLNESCDSLMFREAIEHGKEQCLRMTLGDCLYNEMQENLEWNETLQEYVLIDGADEKWDWLINGHSYTKDDISDQSLLYSPFDYINCGCGCLNQNCESFHWDGIIKMIDKRIPETVINGQTVNGIQVKKSFVAYYIYWIWSLSSDSFTSSTGEQTANVKNASRISNSSKRIEAYNKFVSWVIDCNSHGKVGLYRFMQDFSNLYPEWDGKCLKYEPIW